MIRIPVRPALALAAAATLLTGCGALGDELDREADPARASAPVKPEPLQSTPPAPDLEPSPAETSTPCEGDGFKASAGMVNAAMGLRAMSITLTYCGTSTYEVNGYPSLTVLDADRDPVAIEVLKGTDGISTGIGNAKPEPLVLRPGDSITTSLAWRNTVTDATRPAPHGTYFDIAPAPGRAGHVLQPGDGGPIDIGSKAQLGVSAWEKKPATEPAPSRPGS
ncbi:DUF4232 domain-containing protein [Streptomyces sp. NPDC050418]|uniref:DUF4232 domain-containing protein n=1 Tax=Streptomyces sp. NPDC050418 TaxID=3365612 RepID=UPI0037A8AB02